MRTYWWKKIRNNLKLWTEILVLKVNLILKQKKTKVTKILSRIHTFVKGKAIVFFVVGKIDMLNTPRRIHLRYFYFINSIINTHVFKSFMLTWDLYQKLYRSV